MNDFITPPQAAKLLRVHPDKVVAWINSGELVAMNLATDPNGLRPRWRIARTELEKFLAKRQLPVGRSAGMAPKFMA
tara:strand:- start:99 stop:329 length:231 start_codon:yes stop_codon:yes gene_type:complete